METNLVLQGVELMLLGMGIVFGFLTVLVFTLRGMSLLADRLDGSAAAQPAIAAPIDVSENSQLLAAISAAVARYRSQHPK